MANKKIARMLEKALAGLSKAQDMIEAQATILDSVKALIDEESSVPVKAKPAKAETPVKKAKVKKEVEPEPKVKKKTSKVKSKKVKGKKPVAAD